MSDIYLAKNPGYVLCVRDPEYNYNVPQGVAPQQIRPALVVDFMDGGVLGSGRHAEMDMTVNAAFGGVFDLDEQAGRLGWTAAEKQIVKDALDRISEDPRQPDVQRFTAPTPVAPWPTYDETHHLQIAKIAAATGMVAEAIGYERATRNREGLIAQLAQLQAEQAEERQAEEALTAA